KWDSGMSRLALTCVANHVPLITKPKYWVIQQRLIRHANRCLNVVSSGITGQANDVSTLGSMHSLGILYSDQGKLAEAETMWERALQGKEKTLGTDHIST